MRDIIKLGVRLLIFTLVAGLLLAVTNEVTKGPIAEQTAATANAARLAVLPQAEEFVAYPFEPSGEYPDLREVYVAKAGGETAGYTFLVAPRGYKAAIEMTLGVSKDGAVTKLVINSQTETAGLGSKVAGEEFLSQFPGRSADPDDMQDEFDAITGATVSSKAVLKGLTQATAFLRDVFHVEGRPAAGGEDAEGAGEIEKMLADLRAAGDAPEAAQQIERYLARQGG